MAEGRHIPLRHPLLFGGISDQPASVRHPSQVEDAENVVFSVAHGATKRPGTEYVATISTLPNALGSGSAAPAADGGGPAACVPGNHASSYTVGYGITGTDPVGAAISHTSQTKTVTQHSGLCLWSGAGTKVSTLTPYILLGLDTVEKLWYACFLLVPDTPIDTTSLHGNSLNVSASTDDPDDGSYPNTSQFGAAGNYLLTVSNITVS
jgi:hypothetical protein